MGAMYSHLRIAVVAAVVLAATAVVPGRPPAGGALSEKELRAALLDAVDFPEGWASDSARSARERGFGVPEPTERECRELFDSAEDTKASAGFAKTRSGPFVTTVVASHEDEDAARGALDGLREATSECATIHTREGSPGGDSSIAYQAAALDVDEVGEDSTAIRFNRQAEEGESGETKVVADLVVARVGAHLVRVAQAGRDDSGTGDVADIADRAVRKLEQVCDGRSPAPRQDQPGTTDL
ncbi:hypothetical protein [Streptomyces mayteni]